jgi:hypothetical protein
MMPDEIAEEVRQLDAFIRGHPWFDFDLSECSPYHVTLTGGLDTTGGAQPAVEVRFKGIFYVSLLTTWRSDTSRPVAVLLGGDEARRANMALRVEVGHHLVRFRPEGYADGDLHCLVVARSMTWQADPKRR